MDAEPVAHVLTEFQRDLPDLLGVVEIGHAGDPVANALYRRHIVLVHDAGIVQAGGKSP